MKLVRNWYWKLKFRRFLKKRGALEAYYRNFEKDSEFFERNVVGDWIVRAFVFFRTLEGHGYWADLNLEWSTIVKKTKFIAK